MDPATATVGQVVREALADALSMLLPVDCAGCGRPDRLLCRRCRGALDPDPVRQMLPEGTPVCSGLVFEGVPARVVRALKEDGHTGLARPLARALAVAAESLAGPGVRVVAVPTSRAAMRRRGYRVAELLARRAGLAPVRALRQVRATADQRGLGVDERAGNVRGSMRASGVRARRVLVVDDVVTSGATLAEAVRALRAGGAEVVGAATVAATVRRHRAGVARSVRFDE